VQLSLHSGNTEEIVQLLLQEKASIGLIEGPSRHREVRTEPFMEDEMVLIAPGDFEGRRLSRAQLLGSILLMREQGSGSLKSFKNVMHLDSTETIKSAVEAGLGVGMVSRWCPFVGVGCLPISSVPIFN
jgi:DNA-binding transcriptional LysR family regulator